MLSNTFLIFNQKRKDFIFGYSPSFFNVEMEGVEPSSKRGINMLSTCLFQPLVFERWQDLDHQPTP